MTRTVHPDGLPAPRRYWAMAAVAIGIGMAVLDSAIANIALPSIAAAVHASPEDSTWVVNAYQLAVVMLLLPAAAIGERIGYRPVYQGGLALFVTGSLWCALSGDLAMLVAGRVLQGIGSAGMMSVNGALIRYVYPHELVGRGIGLNALILSFASAIGPTLAAAILAVGSWQWLFAINVPFGLANAALTLALPWSDRSDQRFAWRRALLIALTLGLFFLGADGLARGAGRGVAPALAMLAAAGVAGTFLVARERHAAQPLLPLDLLALPAFALATIASILAYMAYMLAFIALPFYFERGLALGAVATGLLMTPFPVALGVSAPLAGRLADRYSNALLGAVGMALMTIGMAALALSPARPSLGAIAAWVALSGLGFGLFNTPNNRTMLTAAPRTRAGAAGGMLATARLIGMTLGASLTAMAFTLAGPVAIGVALGLAAALALASAGVSLARIRR